jgi:hypothetical protein
MAVVERTATVVPKDGISGIHLLSELDGVKSSRLGELPLIGPLQLASSRRTSDAENAVELVCHSRIIGIGSRVLEPELIGVGAR